MISDDDIANVRAATRIDEVIGQVVHLTRDGSRYKGLCPFHDERTPSFKVNPSEGFYHCFGCNASGDVFTFLMEVDHLSFPEAVRHLAERAGIHLQVDTSDTERFTRHRDLSSALEAAAVFFAEQLDTADAAIAREELLSRGFTKDEAEAHRCGYAPFAATVPPPLTEFSPDILKEAGLVSASGRPFFRNRLMWPITDQRGRIAGFAGRRLSDADHGGKYVNSPTTPLFQKSHLLYRLPQARRAAAKAGRVVIVEGYTDVMACEAAGIPAVATCGTAFTADHLTALARATSPTTRLVFAFDPDAAGSAALIKAWIIAQPVLDRCEAVLLPDGDPCDIRKRGGNTAVQSALKASAPMTQVALGVVIDHELGETVTPESQSRAIAAANGLLADSTNPVIRSGYRQVVADRVGVDIDLVPTPAPGTVRAAENDTPLQTPPSSGTARLEAEFWAAVLQTTRPWEWVHRTKTPWFAVPTARELHQIALRVPPGDTWAQRLHDAAPETMQALVARFALEDVGYNPDEAALTQLANTLEEAAVRRHVDALVTAIEDETDPDRHQLLMEQWEQALSRLDALA